MTILTGAYSFPSEFSTQAYQAANLTESGGVYTMTVNESDPLVANGPRAEMLENFGTYGYLHVVDTQAYVYQTDVLLDGSFPSGAQIVAQQFHHHAGGGPQPLGLNVTDGEWRLVKREYLNSPTTVLWSETAKLDVYYTFKWEIRHSKGGCGVLKFYKNGEKVYSGEVNTIFPTESVAPYFKFGAYVLNFGVGSQIIVKHK
jgi:hypothetical protein